MKITRDVILDLLPLYLADEVSPDARALVEEYLESDKELAEIASQSAVRLPGEIPSPLTQEDRMKAYVETKRLMMIRTIALAAIASFTLVCGGVWAAVALVMFTP